MAAWPTDGQNPWTAALKAYIDDADAATVPVSGLVAAVLTAFGAIMIPVQYNSGTSSWPTLGGTLTSNAAIGWHFIGGDAGHSPPAVSGPAVWDRPTS